MTRDANAPTFNSKKDWVVYLLGEHKLIVSSAIVAASILVAFVGVDVSIPPAAAGIATGWLLIGLPCYFAGNATAKRWITLEWTTVFEINAAEDIREKWFVPPELWREKTVNGPSPRRVNDEEDFEVREFEWMDDVEQVHVEGAKFDATMDSKLVTSRSYAQDIHDYLEDVYSKFSNVRRRVSQMGIDVKRDTTNTIVEALERGVHPDDDSISDAWERAEDDVDSVVDAEIPGLTQDHVNDDMEAWRDRDARDAIDAPGTVGSDGTGGSNGGEGQ